MAKCTCELPRRICACAEARAYDKANPFIETKRASVICTKQTGCNTPVACADMKRCLSREAFTSG